MSLCKDLTQRCARLGVAISFLAVSAFAAQAQVVFSPPKNISNSSGNIQSQQIAVDSRGKINVVWLDNSPGSYAVFFSRSSDGGVTFSEPRNISNQTGSAAYSPQIALDSAGNIFVIWTSFSSANASVLFTRSTDGGSTFSAPQLISHTSSYGAGGQMAVASSGNLDVVWAEENSGNATVFFSHSTDGGATFSPAQSVSNQSGGGPQIAVDPSGNINVLWEGAGSSNYYVWFSRSSDGGSTFSSAYLVEARPISTSFLDPSNPPLALQIVTDENGTINLIWTDSFFNGDWFDFYVQSSHSTDGGATFSAPQTVANPGGGTAFSTIAAGPSGTVNVLFQTNASFPYSRATGVTDTLKRSVDGGATFSAAWNSDACADANGAPAVATEVNGKIDIAYGFFNSPNCSNSGLLFTQSSDGTSFSSPQNVSGHTPSASPVITTDSSENIYLVWQEELSPLTSANQNVMFSRTVALSSVTLSATSVSAGNSATATVSLNGPAPVGGAVVSLSSSNPAVASVPASVTVAEGTTSVGFPVATSAVPGATNVTIFAAFNGITQNSSLTVQLTYNFSGYLPPLVNDGSSLFHSGRTVPVKFQLTAPDGSMITNAVATAQVYLIQNTPTGTVDQSMATSASGGANSGASFRFDATSGQYIYNLNTSGYASGTYVLRTTISDGSTHDVQFSIQ